MALGGFLALSIPVLGAQGEEKVPCVVCGYLMNKDEASSIEHEGNTYYYCSPDCKAYFLKDPAAFAAGMDMDPVCGMTVKKAGSVEAVHNGRQIHFCSSACKDKYFANPAEYEVNYDVVSCEVKPQKEMKYTTTFEGYPLYFTTAENKAAFEKNPGAYIYAECPVGGKVFLRKDAGATVEHGGKTYYFCCKDCLAKFNADPKKYLGPRKGTAEGCAHEHGDKVKEMKKEKKGEGSAEAGCPAKKKGTCPMAKECAE
jgi:Cu+-exporting ATPase